MVKMKEHEMEVGSSKSANAKKAALYQRLCSDNYRLARWYYRVHDYNSAKFHQMEGKACYEIMWNFLEASQ
jgi:hypothetical protein